jgi:RHS repeat-associated protein
MVAVHQGRRVFSRSGLTRVPLALTAVTALLAGAVVSGGAGLLPWSSPASSVQVPGQAWGSAAGQSGEVAGATVNSAMPQSESTKYPQPAFPPPIPPANPVSEGDAPTEVRGFDPATSQEDVGERRAGSRTFRNTDGTMTTEFSQSPMNYRRADGSWQPIDTTLVADGDGWRNAADDVQVRFEPQAAADPFVRMRWPGGQELSFGMAGASRSAARTAGSSVTYPGVTAGTDLRIDALAGGIKETLVLASPDAAHSWVFPLRLNGLTAHLADGRVALRSVDGKELAQIPPGFMTDSAAVPAASNAVRYELIEHDGGQALRMSADPAWLRDPARVYPVEVDPSVKGFTASAAVATSGGARAGGTELMVGNGSVMYLKFDPAAEGLGNHRIFNAQLYLSSFMAPSCRPEPVTVHPITEAWDPAGSGHPRTGGSIATASFAHGYVAFGQPQSACPHASDSIDLGEAGRDLVQSWVRGGANNGLAVKAVRSWKKFVGLGADANKPRMFVTHTKYDAAYRIVRGVPEPPVHRQQDGKIRVEVTNRGAETWTKGAYKLAYRAFTAQGKAVMSRESAALPRDIPPGGTVTLDATIFRFVNPGDYLLDFSMVHNGVYFTDEQIKPARLTITMFELPPVVKAQYPPAGHTAPTLTPQLWADAVDVDAPAGAGVKYEFQVCGSKVDGTPDTARCSLSPKVASKTWTVPSGQLQWSETYHWRAFAYDAAGIRSEALPFSALLTAVPQPEITSHLGGAPYSAGDLDFDPQTGNYVTGAVDAAVSVTGPELTLSRTYNSLDPRKDTLFGSGWSTRYDMRVVHDQDGSGNSVVTYPDGQQVRFGRNANGTYDPPPGRAATFYQDTGTSTRNYVLVDKSNTVYTFREGDGRLITVHDNAGRMLEFDYGENGQIKRAISRASANRTLYFTWTGGHVTEVRTDAPVAGGTPIKWTYAYAGDRLTSVCDPKGGCTRYDYEVGSHYRTAVLDSAPDSYWRLGEPAGTPEPPPAVSQIETNLAKDWGAHQNTTPGTAGPLAGSPDTATAFNGTTSLVALPQGVIKKSRDLAIELWFRTTSGGPLIGFQTAPYDRAQNGAVPALYVDRDGKLRGQFWHGRVAPITTTGKVNDGNWHHVVLSGSLATQAMYLDGVKAGTTDGVIDNSAMNSGQIGAAHAVGPSAWEPAGWWPGVSKKHFTGDIDEVAVYQHPIGEEAARAHFRAGAAADQLTKVTVPSGRQAAKLAYDTVNDRVREYTDDNGGLWKLSVPHVSGTEKKDAAGRTVRNLVRTIEVTDPGNRSRFFDYDGMRGRIIRFAAPLGTGLRMEDRPDPSVVPTTPTTAPPCADLPPTDPDGAPVYCGGSGSGTPDWTGGPVQSVGVRTYDYDASGFQQTITDENGHRVELTNDERGNIVSRKTCREPAVCDTEYFTYYKPDPGKTNDTDPRIDKQLTARDGRSSGPTDNRYLTASDYDTRGELLKQTMPDGTSVTHGYTDGNTAAEGGGNEPAGLLKWTKDALGKQTAFRYFSNGDLASTTEPGRTDAEAEGVVTKYRYDLLGRQTAEIEFSDTHPQGLETKFGYDELNRPAEVADAPVTNAVTGVKHTKVTRTTYDPDGQPLKVDVTDATGGDGTRTTSYTYDEWGRQDSVTDAEGAKTTYGYDVFGNRTWVVDANGTRVEYAYTARNRIAEIRLRGWHGKPVSGGESAGEEPDPGSLLVTEANTYDLGGRLIRQVDAMGRKTVYEYTPNGLVFRVLAEIPVAGGNPRRVVLEQNSYDGAGNLVRQVGPNGTVTQYTVDAVGRSAEILHDPAGLARRTAYRYDANGNVTQVASSGNGSNTSTMQSSASSVVDYTYDNVGNEISETIQFSNTPLTTTRRYDKRGLLIAETDPRGNMTGADPAAYTTEYRYDEAERQVAVTMPAIKAESGGTPATVRPAALVGYNAFGDEVQNKDENGQVSRTAYDKVSRPVRFEMPDYTPPGGTQPIKGVVSTKYDANGNAIEVTSARGAVSRLRYDQMGRLVQRQDPKADNGSQVGGVWTYTYTHNDEPLSVTDPTGARRETTYDPLGRVATTTVLERKPTAAAYTTKYEYNDAGDLLKSTSPTGDVTSYGYDALSQQTSMTDPSGAATQLGYDGLGRAVWQRDPMGRTSFTRYDTAGRDTGTFSLDGQNRILRRTSYTHDAAGNVLTATDPLNRVTRYQYDALSRLTSRTEPVSDTESITTSYGYDAQGNQTRFTDGRGNNFHTTYNSLSLPESVIEPATAAHPVAADRTWSSSYDEAGNPTKMTAPGGIVRTRQYDALDRVTKETGTGPSIAGAERTRVYDEINRVREINAPNGRNVYEYNDRSALLSATGPSGNASYVYDGDGRLTSRTDASGTSAFSYTKGRVGSAVDGVTGVSMAFDYNAASEVTSLRYGTSRTRTFDYDALGREKSDIITEAGATLSSLAYEYDNSDRLTRKVTTGLAGAGDNTYTYDDDNRLKSWSVGGTTTDYAWDASGNRVRNGAKTAQYDERNRILSDGDYTYKHTPSGAQASRTSSGLEEKFSFDAFDRLIEVGSTKYTYDGADRVVARGTTPFSYAGFGIDPVADGAATYGRDASGSLLSIGAGADKRLTVSDRHGDVIGGMAASGTGMADSTAFDPFGKVTAGTGTQRQVGYQGDWTDPATGQVNMGARWYQPGTGGFASRDTVTGSGGPSIMQNRYAYGAGRPLDMIDPDGHWPKWLKKAAEVTVSVVKEVSGYNDVANFIRNPSLGNFLWAASNFVPFGKVAKLAKGARYLYKATKSARKYGDDAVSAGRRFGDDAASGVRRYGDDAASSARKYGDDVGSRGKSSWSRRGGSDFKHASGRGFVTAAQHAAERAAAAARAAAARRAAMRAITERAQAAIAHAAKNNPLPILQAALKPRVALKDLVSSAPSLPARKVSSVTANVQDGNKVWATVKATIIKPGTSVVQSVAEQAVTDYANSQIPGLGDVLSLVGPARHRGNGAADDAGDRARSRANGTCPITRDRNSFTGDTPVLMADGTVKRIDQIREGDEVRATDPTTGETANRTVTDTRSHISERALYEITVTDGGTASTVTASTVTATDEHPFWVESIQKWKYAKDLNTGDLLRTAAGTYVQITAVQQRTAAQLVHNLTVDDLHTYYVVAGNQTLLVHNDDHKYVTPVCDLINPGPYAAESIPARSQSRKFRNGEKSEIQRIGNWFGCHSCGTMRPDSRSGLWILDHQPVSRLIMPGTPQRLYPHCEACSTRQGGLVAHMPANGGTPWVMRESGLIVPLK